MISVQSIGSLEFGPFTSIASKNGRAWRGRFIVRTYDPAICRGKNIIISGKMAISKSPSIMIQT